MKWTAGLVREWTVVLISGLLELSSSYKAPLQRIYTQHVMDLHCFRWKRSSLCVSVVISRASLGARLRDHPRAWIRWSGTDVGLQFIHLHFSNLLPNVANQINGIQLICTCQRPVWGYFFLLIKAFEVLAWLFIYQLGGNENYLRAV